MQSKLYEYEYLLSNKCRILDALACTDLVLVAFVKLALLRFPVARAVTLLKLLAATIADFCTACNLKSTDK